MVNYALIIGTSYPSNFREVISLVSREKSGWVPWHKIVRV